MGSILVRPDQVRLGFVMFLLFLSTFYLLTSRNVVVRALQALTDIRPPFPTPWGKNRKFLK